MTPKQHDWLRRQQINARSMYDSRRETVWVMHDPRTMRRIGHLTYGEVSKTISASGSTPRAYRNVLSILIVNYPSVDRSKESRRHTLDILRNMREPFPLSA